MDGYFFRSKAIDEVLENFKGLAGMVKSEWQNGENVFWQRVDGAWRRCVTQRRGFQGLRLVTVLFCCSTRRALRSAFALAGPEIERPVPKPAYQDDQYLSGALGDLGKAWPRLKTELAAGCHELNM